MRAVGLAILWSSASLPIIRGPMPAKFIFESFRWSVPPRFIDETIFCIQFSPVSRRARPCSLSFFSRGNSPQKVKNTVVCMPIAAPVVARISCGHTLSRSPLQAKITSFLSFSSSAISSSPLPDDETEHTVVSGLLHELVAGRTAPCREVRNGSGIGGQCFQQLARLNRLHGHRRLHDRQRAGQSLQVQRLSDGGAHLWVPPFDARSGIRPWGTVTQYSRLNSHLAACQCRCGWGGTGGWS